MPAPHAGDRWSEAGHGRQFIALKAFLAMHSLGKRIQLGATPGEGSSFRMVAVRKHRSRTSVQAGVISQPRPGQHRGLRPFLPLCPDASGRISFVKRPCRCNSGGRLHPFCSRSPSLSRRPPRGTTSRASTVSRCIGTASTSLRTEFRLGEPFRPASIKVMQSRFGIGIEQGRLGTNFTESKPQ
jgi:hypothetical protein